jgi:hypothetical protein
MKEKFREHSDLLLVLLLAPFYLLFVAMVISAVINGLESLWDGELSTEEIEILATEGVEIHATQIEATDVLRGGPCFSHRFFKSYADVWFEPFPRRLPSTIGEKAVAGALGVGITKWRLVPALQRETVTRPVQGHIFFDTKQILGDAELSWEFPTLWLHNSSTHTVSVRFRWVKNGVTHHADRHIPPSSSVEFKCPKDVLYLKTLQEPPGEGWIELKLFGHHAYVFSLINDSSYCWESRVYQ